MNKKRAIRFCLFFSLALVAAAMAVQDPAVDPELEQGVLLAQQGEFKVAITTLDAVARRLEAEGGRHKQLARAYVYLSIAYLGLSQEQEAKTQFLEALRADRELRLSVDEFPPKFIQFFEQARQEAEADGTLPPPDPPSSPSIQPPAEAAAPPALSAGSAAGPPVIFKKVDFYRTDGEDEKKYDARLTLDPEGRVIVIADEKKGKAKAIYARIPYTAVTELVYESSKSRRWRTALLTRGTQHWLTIGVKGVENLPGSYVYMRLDKGNHDQILSALEAATGIEARISVEE
jgi:hypothetical protein